VIEEMAEQIGKQHKPADHADLADADAVEERSDLLERKPGHLTGHYRPLVTIIPR
jgi:hypothetical protein